MNLLILLTYLACVQYPLCVAVKKRDVHESLIQLRDQDFVGEDKTLSALLSERLAALKGPIDYSDLVAHGVKLDNRPKFQPKLPIEPDRFELSLRRYPKVNVSLDYGEMFNVNANDSVSMEVNWSWLVPQKAAPLNFTSMLGPVPGRRAYKDPSYEEYNKKVLEIMRQNIYSVQNKLIDIEPMIQKHQDDERFRIAYIFNRLDEWKRNIRTLYHAMNTTDYRFQLQLFYYEHVLRVNIDITYSCEFLIHLHGAFMAKMEEILPRKEREELQEAMRKREEMKKMQQRSTMHPYFGR